MKNVELALRLIGRRAARRVAPSLRDKTDILHIPHKDPENSNWLPSTRTMHMATPRGKATPRAMPFLARRTLLRVRVISARAPSDRISRCCRQMVFACYYKPDHFRIGRCLDRLAWEYAFVELAGYAYQPPEITSRPGSVGIEDISPVARQIEHGQ
ncbi:uncharacterized protein LAESUDRAFT_451044 [Laetiporus sulphureus 93-53]|uniref:Uncharacterized protein n=1 Tax=Laetiporus sulphureus 93-53 TaxID=1314785 RepID=A0A165BWU0_9APHY|nr:uncharacterized protein LAESUDRAFT_451044 [Laetiporus sulphureus 93-53]KZT01795.1 hypothetical protein LAESUDRAFT_451044 [Laetiporus sulphureus 93-53]